MRGNGGKERRREGTSMGVKDGGSWVEAVVWLVEVSSL